MQQYMHIYIQYICICVYMQAHIYIHAYICHIHRKNLECVAIYVTLQQDPALFQGLEVQVQELCGFDVTVWILNVDQTAFGMHCNRWFPRLARTQEVQPLRGGAQQDFRSVVVCPGEIVGSTSFLSYFPAIKISQWLCPATSLCHSVLPKTIAQGTKLPK